MIGRKAAYRSSSCRILARTGLIPLTVVLLGQAPTASALTIKINYESSVTSQANASVIEAAFSAVANQFEAALQPNIVVNINVGWNTVGGQALPSGTIGSSRVNFIDGYSLDALREALVRAHAVNPQDTTLGSVLASFPTVDPTHLDTFFFTTAQARAVGYLPPQSGAIDGGIGFKSTVTWDFNQIGGISTGAYDFQGVAAHEIGEVLGRLTGLKGRPIDASLLDLLRYSASGVHSFSGSQAAYFSIDGGVTNLGNFNYSGSGDRSDWAKSTTDAQTAYFSTGRAYAISESDWTQLLALGWGNTNNPGFNFDGTPKGAQVTNPTAGRVPGPASWSFALLGLAGLYGRSRKRRA